MGIILDHPILIQGDPNRASTGQTDITDIGGGLYHIDTFFDLFTELLCSGEGRARRIPIIGPSAFILTSIFERRFPPNLS